MRPERDATIIYTAKLCSVLSDKPVMTVPVGPSDETFTFESGLLVNYENTAAMRMER